MLFEQHMQTRNEWYPTYWHFRVNNKNLTKRKGPVSALFTCVMQFLASLNTRKSSRLKLSVSNCHPSQEQHTGGLTQWASTVWRWNIRVPDWSHSLGLQIKSTSSNTIFSLHLQKPRLFWCYPEQFKITLWRLLLYAFLLSKALMFPVMEGTAWFKRPSIHPSVFSQTSIRAADLIGSLKEVI